MGLEQQSVGGGELDWEDETAVPLHWSRAGGQQREASLRCATPLKGSARLAASEYVKLLVLTAKSQRGWAFLIFCSPGLLKGITALA